MICHAMASEAGRPVAEPEAGATGDATSAAWSTRAAPTSQRGEVRRPPWPKTCDAELFAPWLASQETTQVLSVIEDAIRVRHEIVS